MQSSTENINFTTWQDSLTKKGFLNSKKKDKNYKQFKFSKTFGFSENCSQNKINNNASLRLIKKEFKDHQFNINMLPNEQNQHPQFNLENFKQNISNNIQLLDQAIKKDEQEEEVSKSLSHSSESIDSNGGSENSKVYEEEKKINIFIQNQIKAKSQELQLRKEQEDSSERMSYYSEKSEISSKAQQKVDKGFHIDSLNNIEGSNQLKQKIFEQSISSNQNKNNKQNDKSSLKGSKNCQDHLIFDNQKDSKEQQQSNKIKKQGINIDDILANDSFDIAEETYEFNFIEELTPQPRTAHKAIKFDNNKFNPFQNPIQPQFQLQTQKMQSQIETLNLNSNNHSSSQVNKTKVRIYLRSTNTEKEDYTGEEKSFQLDIITEQILDKKIFKTRQISKDILLDHGICVLSKKGNQIEKTNNMSDYFVYLDEQIKLFSLFMGHGAYGNKVSNLSSRLLFKHFFREQLIKLQPQIGFKRLFMNVDKYISQHITYYDLENQYNCMLSGASCTLVLIQQNKIFVAYVGNIQAIIFRQQFCYKTQKQNQIQMSGFHIPANQYEKERIQKNTGEIRQWKNDFIDRVFVRGRTFPGIEVTRCFGNDIAKMIGVTNEPDIYYHEISKQNDAFLLLTTPNFFDYISYEEVYQILNSFNQKTVKKAQELLQKRIKNLYSQEIEVINDLAFIVYYFF